MKISRWTTTLLALALLTGCGQAAPAPAGHVKGTATKAAAPPLLPDAIGVMIENAPAARPQSGLDQAQVVYEMMAEGGITRYLAYFDLNQTATVGPVRSARIYYVNIDRTYGLPLAHAGGNVDALKVLRSTLASLNIDGLFDASPWMYRIPSRKAPHNLYTTIALLNTAVMKLGAPQAPLRMWPTGPQPKGGTPTASVSVIWASNALYRYATSFTYGTGGYTYGVDGATDLQADGSPIVVPNVVILDAVTVPDPDPYTVGSINYGLTSGQGWLMRGGKRYRITWTFGTNGFTFTSPTTGAVVPLAPGKVFVQIVPEPEGPTFPTVQSSSGS